MLEYRVTGFSIPRGGSLHARTLLSITDPVHLSPPGTPSLSAPCWGLLFAHDPSAQGSNAWAAGVPVLNKSWNSLPLLPCETGFLLFPQSAALRIRTDDSPPLLAQFPRKCHPGWQQQPFCRVSERCCICFSLYMSIRCWHWVSANTVCLFTCQCLSEARRVCRHG